MAEDHPDREARQSTSRAWIIRRRVSVRVDRPGYWEAEDAPMSRRALVGLAFAAGCIAAFITGMIMVAGQF